MQRSEDAALVDRLLEREADALRRVVAAHGSAVFGVARRVLADPGLAEEVAQDTFLALWRRPGAYDADRGPLRAFLVTIARNKAVDLVRKHEARARTKDALMAELHVDGDLPAQGFDGVDDRLAVRAALGTLTPVQREALVLAYFGGRTYREVATELGIPEGTAKTRMRDALLALKRTLAPRESS